MHFELYIGFLGLLASAIVMNIEAGQMRGQRRFKTVGIQGIRGKPEQRPDGSTKFPRHLEYDIEMEGDRRTLFLELNPYMQMPRERMEGRRKFAFYVEVNTGESLACIVKQRNGHAKCNVAGIIERNNETCFVSPNSDKADCVPSDGFTDGELIALNEKGEMVSKITTSTLQDKNKQENVENRTQSQTDGHFRRRKRSAGLPEPGYKAVEVAFVGDEAFMLPFYNRNPGDDAAAEEEAELFATLLANEMSVFYRSVKEVSNGDLDIVIYPASFTHPVKGNNFNWSSDNIVSGASLDGYSALPDFITFASVNLNDVQYDHAMALTGLDLWAPTSTGNGLLGIAYINTVCAGVSHKVSLQENFGYNLGWIASHELGHALGSGHDDGGAGSGCSPGLNIMSSYLFNPDPSTQDTYTKFSICSVQQFTNHLDTYPDCLTDNGFSDDEFEEKFCAGLLGNRSMSLDIQCQVTTGASTATACSTTVTPDGCYLPYQVSCRTAPTQSCTYDLRFVWNGSPCGDGMFCYRGYCVTEFDICQDSTATTVPTPGVTTTTSATTTTTPTTTTTTPTTTTTTPTTTTTSTTTPTTTTTTPTTTTTTPTTTTTTPTTTTTTPTTTTTTTTPTTTTTTPTTTTTTPTTTTTTPTTTTTTPTTTTTTPTTTTTTPTTTTTTPTTTTTTPTITTTTPTTTTTTPTTTTTTPTTTTTTSTTTTPTTTTTTPTTTTPTTTTTTSTTTTTTPTTTTTTPTTTTTTTTPTTTTTTTTPTTTTTTTTPITTTPTPTTTTTTPITTTPTTTTTTPITTTPTTTTTTPTTTTPLRSCEKCCRKSKKCCKKSRKCCRGKQYSHCSCCQ